MIELISQSLSYGLQDLDLHSPSSWVLSDAIIDNERINYWDWAAANASAFGGFFSGLASGAAAYFIFRQGIKTERKKQSIAERKIQSQKALSAFMKIRKYVDSAVKIRHQQSLEYPVNIMGPSDIPMRPFSVLPAENHDFQFEQILVDEVIFLAKSSSSEFLLNDVFDLEAWARRRAALCSEYSKLRHEWDQWFSNLIPLQAYLLGNKKSPPGLTGSMILEAKIRMSKMNSLLSGILDDHLGADRQYVEVLEQYHIHASAEFEGDFPLGMEISELLAMVLRIEGAPS
ncbi:hypothetical protein [Marivivens aquimaris]|uniref:hypothetical protein n=1 Tax=Marivivens aquimaris TaxID=2774876 RepID=UPI00187EA2BC|nr:hypothetical protein [Marivivens aquimaris]